MIKAISLRLTRRFGRDRSGVAAVEFAIAAPMLLFGLIIMTDLGLAIQERMNLDQAVRSGAEFLMGDVTDEDTVKKYIIASATGAYSDNPGDVEKKERPTVTVVKTCECPENPGTAVDCTTTICTNLLPASVYYELTAAKTYEAILVTNIPLETTISVQVR